MKSEIFNKNSSQEELFNFIKNEYNNLPEFTEGQYQGRGIVICAGGANYLANAYVCIKFIRKVTDLKIELFFAGKSEIPDEVKILFENDFTNLTMIDISKPELKNKFPFLEVQDFQGFQIKPYAILYSSFREILFMDADNVILNNPEHLFSSKEYQETGALFWPDLTTAKNTQKALFDLFGLDSQKDIQESEFDSGQIVINKQKCWKALLMICLVNSDRRNLREFCYKNSLGDKDTFRLSFKFAQMNYHLIQFPTSRVGSNFFIQDIPFTRIRLKIQHKHAPFYSTGMLQKDLTGKPFFVHKTVCEWNINKDLNALKYIEEENGDLRHSDDLCRIEIEGHQFLAEFKRKYLKFYAKALRHSLIYNIYPLAIVLLNLLYYLKPKTKKEVHEY